ncbi:MAG: MFS transporter [Bacteroidetes bacterium]|nr:MFS transporter [Bacteroidota bacterium]
MTTSPTTPAPTGFTKYQAFIIAILAILQFTVILDFMILSPLGDTLQKTLHIEASAYTMVVSAYAISAGISGLLAAGFADKFDRKKLLLFFYAGFILGTVMCGLAESYGALLIARIVTGLFGGVLSSTSYAIITDLFKMDQRGRVMGFVQMAFAASQILGIPLGLLLSELFSWHAPFFLIVGFSAAVWVIVLLYMKPVTDHLKIKNDHNPIQHLIKTLGRRDYQIGFLATTLLATGGFMLMPFGAAFAINNLHVSNKQLTLMYTITGIVSIIFGPLIGKLSDKVGKYKLFIAGSMYTMVMVGIYTNLSATPLAVIIGLNSLLFIGVSSRMIASQALMTAVPDMKDRGAFMSINASVQQFSGGLAAMLAGAIVIQQKSGFIENYYVLGSVVIGAMGVSIGFMYFINQLVKRKLANKNA